MIYGMILMIAQCVLVLIALVIALRREFKLAKAFGKGAGFGVGLILLDLFPALYTIE